MQAIGGRVHPPYALNSRSLLEPLESRALLSAGPTLASVEMLGTVNQCTGIVLAFSEPLNAASAQNTAAYAFGHAPVAGSSDDGFDIGDIFAFKYPGTEHAATARPKLVKAGKIEMASAVYDSINDSVTLTPYAPFKASSYIRFLRIKGTGPNTIFDASGNPLNSGKDTVARWTPHFGRTVKYHDANGDHVTLKLKGPGKLYVFTRNSTDTNPIIFLQGATSATTLSGSVKNRGAIFPTVNIAQIEGADSANDMLLTNSEFNVELTTT